MNYDKRVLLSNNHHEKKPLYYDVLDILRFFLMLFVSIEIFGVKNNLLGYTVNLASGSAPIAFFMISGFLVVGIDEDRNSRIKRAIRRTALAFFITLVVYFLINALFYAVGGMNIIKITPYTSKRFWFNFIVLNDWPYDIGGIIWYLQALLYSYIIIYFLNKLKLLKYDYIIFIVLFVFTLVSGEFAQALHFHPLAYAYIPKCFLTCALPYTLLGGFIYRKQHIFVKVNPLVFLALAFLGIIMCPVEASILIKSGKVGYTGHLIGMAVIAFGICVPCFLTGFSSSDKHFSFKYHSSIYFKTIYYIIQPISVVIATVLVIISSKLFEVLQDFMWALSFAVSLLIAFIIAQIRDAILYKKLKRNNPIEIDKRLFLS